MSSARSSVCSPRPANSPSEEGVSPLRIAIVTSSYPLKEIDGQAAAGLFVRDFAAAVANEGHEVHVVTQNKGEGCSFSPSGVRVHCYDWPGKDRPLSSLNPKNPRDAWTAFRYMKSGTRALLGLHAEAPIDHVLAMWAVPGGVFASAMHKREGVSYSVWCLGSDIWTYGKLPVLKNVVSNVLKGATHRYADGLKLRDDAIKLSNADISFMPSSRAIACQPYASAERKQGPTRFQFVGRYDRVKGVDVLLQAMRLYLDAGNTGTLSMLGGGAMDDEVRALAKELDILDHVTIGGYADGEEVRRAILAADALVIPSRNESIPLVLSDALQLGKPVIVSDVGDMGDLIRETPAGLVVRPDDAAGLAGALADFSASDVDRFDIEVAALAERFNIKNTARRFLADIAGGR
jgi:glycosyltransferase involved in cell wall biosynthesis